MVSVHFFKCGFRKDAPRDEFIERWTKAMRDGGEFLPCDMEMMRSGPSYIALGAFLGDQHTALILMALGAFHGLWEVWTPERIIPEGTKEMWDDMAGRGLVMIGPLAPGMRELEEKLATYESEKQP